MTEVKPQDVKISGPGTIMLKLFSQLLIEHGLRYTARNMVSDYSRKDGVRESVTSLWYGVVSEKMTFKAMVKMCFNIFGAKKVKFKIIIEDELGLSSDEIVLDSEKNIYSRTTMGKRNLQLHKLGNRKMSFALYMGWIAKLEGFTTVTIMLDMETDYNMVDTTNPATLTVEI